MTRRGKIERLPADIRHELNCRLQNGQAGIRLVDWKKELLPSVSRRLAREEKVERIQEIYGRS